MRWVPVQIEHARAMSRYRTMFLNPAIPDLLKIPASITRNARRLDCDGITPKHETIIRCVNLFTLVTALVAKQAHP